MHLTDSTCFKTKDTETLTKYRQKTMDAVAALPLLVDTSARAVGERVQEIFSLSWENVPYNPTSQLKKQ